MLGIFSRFGLLTVLLMLASCGGRAPETIIPPKDVAATVEPFLAALRKGQKAEAAAYVFESAADELDAQFGGDHVKLAKGPTLTPRLIKIHPEPVLGADLGTVTIAYAARHQGQWTSATLRVQRVSAKHPYKIEYWRVTNRPPTLSPGTPEFAETSDMPQNARLIFWGIIALFAALVLALLIWAVRNRTRPNADLGDEGHRPSATTTRD